jgi:hypothetical protein
MLKSVWLKLVRHGYEVNTIVFFLFFFQMKEIILMVFNATFNNISVKSGRSVLFVEETGGPGERKPLTCHKSLTNEKML